MTLLILSNCSTINDNTIYKGNYKGQEITIKFTNSKKGYLKVDDKDSIAFRYKIEKNKIEIKSNNQEIKKVKSFVYRFTIDAEHKIDFPLGFYEIGRKKGKILQGIDSLILVKQELKSN